MIEAIVSAALLKIAEGSGGAIVDAIRQRFLRRNEPEEVVGALDRTAHRVPSDEDTARLVEVLSAYAAEDPRLLEALRQVSVSTGAVNSVTSSTVGKLVQAQNVGDVTM
ncbi:MULTISPECIES: hypothetical protein [unclassified Micromonospora]|uniref:hypothetical protein n=1 Tax=unclassified Micromonospora TaxID=2617518 RepID=UPI001035018E|nr:MULTISPECIES: hypothetical protein [unclassified Micromonospora]QKW12735.1 hypothetical protein HUT12_07910 [Verrucosispora sp. NA02020]TBL40635.1 hypothetical protein EYA84_07130 [Verrucosispora sp. SN26_14.1]